MKDEKKPLPDFGFLKVLKNELAGEHEISNGKGNVIVLVTNKNHEGLGELISKIQRLIDLNLPVRDQHLYIRIRNKEHNGDNVFKIWKSVPDTE